MTGVRHRLKRLLDPHAVDLLRLGVEDRELRAVVLEDRAGLGDAAQGGRDEAAERVVAGVFGEVQADQAVELVDVDPGVGLGGRFVDALEHRRLDAARARR